MCFTKLKELFQKKMNEVPARRDELISIAMENDRMDLETIEQLYFSSVDGGANYKWVFKFLALFIQKQTTRINDLELKVSDLEEQLKKQKTRTTTNKRLQEIKNG